VMSSASLISQYNERGESDKVIKHVQRIKSSVNHLTSILNDFLSLGKLEEGISDINKDFFNVKDFMKEIEEEVSSLLKAGQQLKSDYQAEDYILYSDPKVLRNILFNLISNASKYSNEGKSIHLRYRFENSHCTFSVLDEGIGIPKEDQRHMFERFFRASNAGNVQGTGLGLNIVKRYVELLNGSISFKSEYEKGSEFKVVIPTEDNQEKSE
jgi:signal transduction histidine kinase